MMILALLLTLQLDTAQMQGDVATLGRMLTNDWVGQVPSMPATTKLFDTKVRVTGSSAVATGRIKQTRTKGGTTYADDWQFMKVYQRSSGGWQVVSFQTHLRSHPQD